MGNIPRSPSSLNGTGPLALEAIRDDQLLELTEGERTVHALHRAPAVDDRDLRHDTANARVRRADDQYLATAVRDAPDADVLTVELGAFVGSHNLYGPDRISPQGHSKEISQKSNLLRICEFEYVKTDGAIKATERVGLVW